MASTPKSGKTDQYSEEEAQRRFMQSLKGAVNTSPQPLKNKPRKKRGLAEASPRPASHEKRDDRR
jgi:hypothetical protein